MAVAHAIAEHSVLRFREPVRGWPAGTIGTVVSDYGEVMLVESPAGGAGPAAYS